MTTFSALPGLKVVERYPLNGEERRHRRRDQRRGRVVPTYKLQYPQHMLCLGLGAESVMWHLLSGMTYVVVTSHLSAASSGAVPQGVRRQACKRHHMHASVPSCLRKRFRF